MRVPIKRLPYLVSFLLFILLCTSGTYWGLQFLRPSERPIILQALPQPNPINVMDAVPLFGGKVAEMMSNYFLKGVVVADNAQDSIAILAIDDKPAQALGVGKKIAPGVILKKVFKNYVVLMDAGQSKLIELPEPDSSHGIMSAMDSRVGLGQGYSPPQYGGGNFEAMRDPSAQYSGSQYVPPSQPQPQYAPSPQYVPPSDSRFAPPPSYFNGGGGGGSGFPQQ